MQDWGLSPAFSDGMDYSKVWVEDVDGEYTNINAGLGEEYRHQTHIKGAEIEGETVEDRIQRELQYMRDPEANATHPGHDYESHQNAIEFYRNEGREYSDDDIEEADGDWIKKLNTHTFWELGFQYQAP